MNILHLKYAVEVAKTGSINKAAEQLFMAQPNLSRAIKELEADLGITIFDRSAKGMVLTIEGREFINYARQILHQIDEVEHIYKHGKAQKQKFSVSVPRTGYISEAFSRFFEIYRYHQRRDFLQRDQLVEGDQQYSCLGLQPGHSAICKRIR